ncbi:MAG: ATP-binding cassette domain-containing protein [Lautropia sp.]|nr:ATP-binding cassette domain-containing protein [Lautropia sp.]
MNPTAAVHLEQATIVPAGAARQAQPLLQALDVRIASGEHVALIGASGAGKTTLMLALATALPLAGGRLQLWGQSSDQLSTRQRQRLRASLFYAPQVPPLAPRQRVVIAVLAGRLPQMGLLRSLRTLWHPSRADARWAHEMLCSVDLPDKLWHRVDRLSGGERQRVGLARLLASDARLWLVDEPLSALDPTRAAQVMDTLIDTARTRQATLICSLHQVEVARSRFARIIALRGGRIVYDGPSAELSDDRLNALYAADTPPGAVPDATITEPRR